MRTLLALALLLTVTPALAAGWSTYDNARFGYAIEIPPEFSGQGEADNGDGQVFRSRDGSQTLSVWGGFLTGPDFMAEMEARKAGDATDGWTISYEASSPRWISYSGTRNGQILYARAIARCDGQYAMFRLEYSKADAVKLDPVVGKLVQSLRAGRC